MTAHASAEILSAYLDRELPAPKVDRLEEHLEDCPRCRAHLDSLTRVVGHLQRLERTAPPPILADRVARRVNLERARVVGRGGMVERIESKLGRVPVQSSILSTFSLVFALAAILYLFALAVEQIELKRIPVLVATPEDLAAAGTALPSQEPGASPATGSAVQATGTALAPDGVPIAWSLYPARTTTEKPALVFVHCWACDREFWREQVEPLSADRPVVTLDLAGHGESGADRESWSVTGLAGDVQAVIEHLDPDHDLDRVILVGHSMGGPVSLAAAARMSERVVGVVAVDTLHDVEQVWPKEQQEQTVAAFTNNFEGAMAGFVPALNRNADPELIDWIHQRALKVDRKAAVGLIRDFGNLDPAAMMDALDVPVRAVNASANPPFNPETNVAANRRHADYDVVYVEGVGHYLQLQEPRLFNERLRGVLEDLAGRGRPSLPKRD